MRYNQITNMVFDIFMMNPDHYCMFLLNFIIKLGPHTQFGSLVQYNKHLGNEIVLYLM